MSFSVDANLLLYSSDRGSPYHEAATAFLTERAAAPDLFYLCWPTILSYLRIATHPAIFRSPLTPDEAARNVQALLTLPHVRALGEEEGFWEVFRGVAMPVQARGNAVPDAHVAALLRQHGVSVLYTNDADFRRFPFLKIVNPLTAE